MKSSDISSMQFMVILVLIHTFISNVSLDPRAIIYKGKVNIGLLISAHSSPSPQSLCNTISVNGLHNSMANVWSLHMYNQRQRLNSFDEIGVYIYDTCADETVAQRQTVRLISHLYNVGNRICRESKAYPPLIGVIIDGQTYDKSVDLLQSFNIPVITTSEDSHSYRSNASNVFSVAPNIKHLSNSVMSLVKELDLKSVSLVVSDVDPGFDSQLLHLLSASAQNPLNVVRDYDSDTISSDNKKKEKDDSGYIWKRYRRSDEMLSSNTVFYLSPSEAIDLLNSLSGTGDDYNSLTSNYTYIIVTKSDISAQIKTSNDLKRREKLRKNVFLVSPLMENTSEYQKYFQTMVNTIGIKGEQPLIAEYRKANEPTVPDMSVSLMVKAVWALTQAYQNLYQKQCAGNKMNCNLETNNNLTNLMTKSLTNMNTVITGSGLKEVDGIRLRFDSEHKLNSWKYQIMIMSSNWQTISLGHYSADTLLNIDSKFLKTILTNRINRHKNRPKSIIKALAKSVTTNTLSPSSANSLPLYKQAVYSYDNNSISPSNLMRSSIRHQISAASAPIERISTYSDDSYKYNSSTRPPNSDSSHVTRRRYNGLTAWLGTFWSMTILSTSILGILITLYIQTFLLMKSCEGALRKTNQALVISHLIAVTITFLGSSLFVFYPTLRMCTLRHTIHNISLSLLFGSLLIRAMYIRAQKSIGLGGRASRLNQFLTLIFIVGIQTAIEFQKWKYEFSWISSESPSNLASLCIHDGYEYMRSQIYLAIILSILLLMCWSARNTPFNQKEGTQSLIVSILITAVFIISMTAVMNINRSKYNDIIISISMNLYAFCVLLGLFIPLLHTLHKYGVLVPKSGSYADSLSTIFTSFGGTRDLNDSFSHNSSQSRKSKECFNSKISKSFDMQNTNNFFARVSPNCYSNPIPNPYKYNRNKCSLMHNTLYEGVPGFRSAYP